MVNYRGVLKFNLVIIIFLLSSCKGFIIEEEGNGDIISESRKVEDFDGIHLSGKYEVVIQQSSNTELIIKADENLLQYIDSDVKDDILYISNSRRIHSDDGIKLFIRYEDISYIESSGASAVFTEGPLKTKSLELSMSGVGLLELEVELQDLEASLSGAGMIKLSGVVGFQEVFLSGAGNYNAQNLESNVCEIGISGIGSAKVNVRDELDAEVSGVGGIEYIGNPKVKKSTSGLGKIKKLQEDAS